MKITRIELYCKDEATSAVLRALATVKGVLADPPPRPIPVDETDEEKEAKPKNSGPRTKRRRDPDNLISDQVLDALTNRIMTITEIHETTGLERKQVANAADRLRRLKQIRKLAKNRYKRVATA
jgi:hypothetical protein